ncbi:MAG: PD40 domain-containing protein, partial [Methanosarcinales archaeon]|nr:PD40 domain-containing protein [Methanosarcinales archaeon]
MTDNTYTDSHPSWSPDSHKIVFTSTRDGNQEIYVADLLTGTQTRLTGEPSNDDYPEWSPDGSMIAFVSERDGNPEIYSMDIASKAITRLTHSDSIDKHAQWSPDGQNIVFISDRDGGDMDVYAMKADGTGITRLVDWEGEETHPTWSSGHSPHPVYSVGQGAPDLATKNHFIDAYNRNGGATVLGSPTTEVHRAWGYLVQDFPGTSGYAGGIIMYNPYENYAYYIHGAIWERYYNLGGPRAKTDIEFELGPPTSDVMPYIYTEPPEVSSDGTQFRYQNFEGGALNHNIDTGEVFEIHGAIFTKWRELGYAAHDLGLVASDEREAAFSPIGTDGRVSDFEGGHIHWHRTGGHGGGSYETHGAIDAVYCAEGGSGGDLGFPVSDEYVNPSEYPQGDFEGGYITTTDGVAYEAFEYADKTPPTLVIGTPEDSEEAESYMIEVSGVASDESGIYGVRIKVNGKTAAELINSNLGVWNTNVILSYGENEIAVTACDNCFNTATEIITVCYYPDFSFVQIADVHIGCGPESLYSKRAAEELKESKTRFTDTLDAIGDLNTKPAILLITGDLVEWNHESFLWNFRTILEGYIAQENMKGHDISVYCIPGNHDRRKWNPLEDDRLVNYHKYITPGPNIRDEDRFGPDNFTFGYGGYLFIGLDSGKDLCKELWTCDSPESTGLTNPQMNWLGNQNDIAPKIIFMHHPAMHDKS